jgi:prepilin-type N-terminal cleavage/methylation domain-containing protein
MMSLNNIRRLIGMPNSTYPLEGPCQRPVEERTEHGSPGRRNGFTVIEIIIVAIILSIVALTAVPMLSSAGTMQIRAATNMVAADMEYAKSMAISRGQDYSVVFDQVADNYRIEDQNNNVIPHPVKKGFDYIVDFRKDGRVGRVGITGANFGGTTVVTFNSMGSPDNGGTVTLQASGTTVTVMVEPITGYISIQ